VKWQVFFDPAVLTLISLGYKQAEAHKIVRALRDANPKATVEELVKEALKLL
jgi:Holliday junction resolvasome RuvABC DNA-binding subunit